MKEHFKRLIAVTKNPHEFFSKIKNERKNGKALNFVFAVSIIPAAFFVFVSAVDRLSTHSISPGIVPISVLAFFLFVASIYVLVFLESALWHIIFKLLGGRGDFNSTLKCVIYGGGIYYIISIFPLITLLGSFYSIYLTSIGISMLHKIPFWKAIIIIASITILFLVAEVALMGLDTVIGISILDKLL